MWTGIVHLVAEIDYISEFDSFLTRRWGTPDGSGNGCYINSIPTFCFTCAGGCGPEALPPDPGLPPPKRKTAGRAATLTSGPVDSLAAYRGIFYGSSVNHASANRAGGAA